MLAKPSTQSGAISNATTHPISDQLCGISPLRVETARRFCDAEIWIWRLFALALVTMLSEAHARDTALGQMLNGLRGNADMTRQAPIKREEILLSFAPPVVEIERGSFAAGDGIWTGDVIIDVNGHWRNEIDRQGRRLRQVYPVLMHG